MTKVASKVFFTILGGGLVALFFGLIIAAFAVFGLINKILGHILLFAAFLVGSAIIWRELFPDLSRTTKWFVTVVLALAIGGGDAVITHQKRLEDERSQKLRESERRPYIALYKSWIIDGPPRGIRFSVINSGKTTAKSVIVSTWAEIGDISFPEHSGPQDTKMDFTKRLDTRDPSPNPLHRMGLFTNDLSPLLPNNPIDFTVPDDRQYWASLVTWGQMTQLRIYGDIDYTDESGSVKYHDEFCAVDQPDTLLECKTNVQSVTIK